MDGDSAIGLMDGLLWNSLMVCGPILAAALVVGVAVSVLQVATQLQEMTLSYVPKLVACGLMLALLGPWLLGRVTQYAIESFMLIPQLG